MVVKNLAEALGAEPLQGQALSLDDGPAVLAAAVKAFAAGVKAAQAENDRLGIISYGRDPVTGAIVARQPQMPLKKASA